MNVEMTLFGPFRETVGEKTLTLTLAEEATVGDAIETVGEDHPALLEQLLDDDGTELSSGINLTLNRENVTRLDGLDTPLSDGDTIQAAPPIKGG